jgi:hypothetical protein
MTDTHDPFAPAQHQAPAPAQVVAEKPKSQKQWLVNLRTWLPFLQNPQDRQTQVKYIAREKRDGGQWRIVLPAQCWNCSATGDLQVKKFTRSLRCFESPVAIIGIGVMITSILLAAAAIITSLLLMLLGAAALAALATTGLVWIKSWTEEVKISLSTCSKCAVDAREPDMAMDGDDLYVYAFNSSLAEAAIAGLKAERRGKSKFGPDAGAFKATDDKLPMDGAPEEPSGPPKKKKKKVASADDAPLPPPRPATPHTPDLPSIPLDD